MRKQISSLLLGILIFRPGAGAMASGRAIDKETVRKAILIFRQTPLNQQGSMVRPIILRFAQESPAVRIAMDSETMPWIDSSKVPDEAKETLLTAYVAGDVRAQLAARKTKDDPMAGTEQVIATYRQLQKAEPQLKIIEVEKLIDLQKQGKLVNYLAKMVR